MGATIQMKILELSCRALKAFRRKHKEKSSVWSRQVGGSHYKHFEIEPTFFSIANNLDFPQGSVIKYLCRYNLPGGKGVEDLEKAKHYIEMLIWKMKR